MSPLNDGDLTAIQGAAVESHEIFQTFCQAGFTEAQALDLVKSIIVAAMQQSD